MFHSFVFYIKITRDADRVKPRVAFTNLSIVYIFQNIILQSLITVAIILDRVRDSEILKAKVKD